MIRQSLSGVTSREAKSDILTEWKQQDRWDHEVYTSAGVADPAVRRGIYGRAWNRKHQHLNSRDGHYPVRPAQNGLDTYVSDGGGGGSDDD